MDKLEIVPHVNHLVDAWQYGVYACNPSESEVSVIRSICAKWGLDDPYTRFWKQRDEKILQQLVFYIPTFKRDELDLSREQEIEIMTEIVKLI